MKCKNCGEQIERNEQDNWSHWTAWNMYKGKCTNPEPAKEGLKDE